mgnify:CR=1 FL=1
MYTVKSTSDEGVYYLVNHWQQHKRFWVSKEELKRSMLFRRKQDAKTSLKKLLKVMDDYKNDVFEIVEI